MTVRRLLWVVIFAGAVTAVRAADVTLGAYNVERTGYTSEKLAPPLALQWKFTVGEDPAHASAPLCVGDRIFHCALGMVYSLDAESGAVIWSYNTRFQIRATPVLHNNRLFVCTVNGQIHVLDPADESQERVFGVLDIRGGITSDPLIVGEDLFLVADSGRFFRINSATYDSKELHKFDVGAKSYLAWDGENIIFTGTDNRLYCWSTKRNRVLWAKSQGNLVTPPMIVKDGVVLATRDDLRLVKTRSGDAVWRKRGLTAARGSVAQTADGKLVMVDRNEFVYLVDPARGDVISRVETDSLVLIAASVADQTIYLGTGVGNVYAITVGDLSNAWYYRCSPIDTIGPDMQTYAVAVPPVVSNGNLLVATTQGTLLCFRTDAIDFGQPRLHLPQLTTNAVDGSLLALALYDDELREAMRSEAELNAEDGKDPEIPPEAEELALPGKQPIFRFETYVYDEGSGVDMTKIRVEWDGQPYLSELIRITPNDHLLTVDLVGQRTGLARQQLKDGTHILKLTVPDFKGNRVERTFSFKIDNTLPPLEPIEEKPKPEAGMEGGGSGLEAPPAAP